MTVASYSHYIGNFPIHNNVSQWRCLPYICPVVFVLYNNIDSHIYEISSSCLIWKLWETTCYLGNLRNVKFCL